ncbi:MAG: LysM peptidoglycan-binding domain-containing protein [Cellvibrionaceae bacterium]
MPLFKRSPYIAGRFTPFALLITLTALITACDTALINNSSEPAEAKTNDPVTQVDATVESAKRELDPGAEVESTETKGLANTQDALNQNPTVQILKELEPELEPVGNLWDHVREGFEFSEIHVDNKVALKRVDYHRKRLLKYPSLAQRITDNATPYFHYIITQLEQNKLPLEIALLPIVESHYDPFAYSPGRASGMWQFIPSTGKRFGLAQDWWHDERRDTIASTGAAIQYLLYLNKLFDGDWLLAMASYNAGQGRVMRAVKKNRKLGKPTDYWSLDLPKETQHYIPKLLAWRDIIKNHDQYNIDFNPVPDEPYFELVDIGSQIDLAEAAALAEVDIDTIYQLNPAYNRWATDPSPPHDLLIPIDNVNILKENLAKVPVDQRMTWRRYIIKNGDSLGKIAKQFNTSTKFLAQVNGIKNNRIRAGKALMIPSAAKGSDYYTKSAEQRLAKRQGRAPKNRNQRIEHRVKNGESLWDIARKYNVSVSSIARWNNMAPKDVLAVNRKLTVWTKTTTSASNNTKSKQKTSFVKNETRKLFYKVRKGDSLDLIANKFRVKISDIKSWNDIARKKYIQPGQLLTLYVALTDRELMVN